jgi:hypothetical protein
VRARELALVPAREPKRLTRTMQTYRSALHHCSRQALERERPRRQARPPVSLPDRAARRSRMRLGARSQQVPAASRLRDSPPARRQLREPPGRCRDRVRRRLRRVRERTRLATPTTRARTARRASFFWTEPECAATVGSGPTRAWISQRWFSGAPCLSRSSSSDPRTSPSEPPDAVSPSDDQSNDTQNIPQAMYNGHWSVAPETPRLRRSVRHGSQPSKRKPRKLTSKCRNCANSSRGFCYCSVGGSISRNAQ